MTRRPVAAATGPIKTFVSGIYDGLHATPRESESGPVFLGIKNVTPRGELDLSNIRHIAETDYERWIKRVAPRENDIVFSYEATLHRYAILPTGFRGCLGRRMALVRPDTTKVFPRFLYYYFLTPVWRAVVESHIVSGVTVDRIPLAKFPEFEVCLPQLDMQRRLASILAAYDDLIENNRRRIRLLERAARMLYEEWFVRFRFPGYCQATSKTDPLATSKTDPRRNGVYRSTTMIRVEPVGGACAVQTGVGNALLDAALLSKRPRAFSTPVAGSTRLPEWTGPSHESPGARVRARARRGVGRVVTGSAPVPAAVSAAWSCRCPRAGPPPRQAPIPGSSGRPLDASPAAGSSRR